jgi:hypothetical protein
MRFLIAAAAMAAVILGAAAAHAEKRVFIIANNGDGYGVDRCLASGGACGEAVANSYCRSHEFAQAVSFSGPGSCQGGTCDNFVAITCSR